MILGSVHGAESVHGSGGAKSQYGGSVQGSHHSQPGHYTGGHRQLSYHGSREQLGGHHHDPGSEYRQPGHRHRQPDTIYDEQRDRG